MTKIIASILFSFLFLNACVTTPVSERSALILVPFEQEVALGVQAFDQILTQEKESNDARLKEIVNRVGHRIADASDMPDLEWEFKLIESDQQNAFALPGGKVAVYTGILSVAKNEAGLATILGHEIGHAIARHGAQRMSQQMLLQGAMTAAAINLQSNPNQPMIMAALGLGVNVGIQLPFSRMNESEADEIGLIYMAQAGYDPREAVNFWGRFNASKSEQPPEFLSTHPSDATRISNLQGMLQNAISIYEKSSNKVGLGQNFF
ncbi:MAG: M48 family metallopeptidase [Candidatus Nitrohelix vancouverensis]|uniref:M48 family metallopeptidase n=1 Tax=Candidatus Nitrohelix vancouverensis TaxID=2705534 RepID=A0A7T0C425_9BACT|nr:MAG: M48 family metallopeptidase [Candidatus Nitrohelix vancouverensis]